MLFTDVQNDMLFTDVQNEPKMTVSCYFRPETATRGEVGKIIEDVYVNEIKKTITVKFVDGTIQTVTCHKKDEFDPVVGVAIAVSSFVFGSKKNFHNVVQRKLKKSAKKSK